MKHPPPALTAIAAILSLALLSSCSNPQPSSQSVSQVPTTIPESNTSTTASSDATSQIVQSSTSSSAQSISFPLPEVPLLDYDTYFSQERSVVSKVYGEGEFDVYWLYSVNMGYARTGDASWLKYAHYKGGEETLVSCIVTAHLGLSNGAYYVENGKNLYRYYVNGDRKELIFTSEENLYELSGNHDIVYLRDESYNVYRVHAQSATAEYMCNIKPSEIKPDMTIEFYSHSNFAFVWKVAVPEIPPPRGTGHSDYFYYDSRVGEVTYPPEGVMRRA